MVYADTKVQKNLNEKSINPKFDSYDVKNFPAMHFLYLVLLKVSKLKSRRNFLS